ncbi:MAG: SH3 domain-containing protein [Chloroflexi bacterium]|nr:SH3 domain-containing protein [Chloroflexota bacterium]
MPSRRRLLAWLSLAPAVGVVPAGSAAMVPDDQADEPLLQRHVVEGVAVGLALTGAGALTLTGEPAAWSEQPYVVAGVLVGPPLALSEPATAVTATWVGAAPDGTEVRLEVRGGNRQQVTPWVEAPRGGGVVGLEDAVTAVQYRLTLLAMDPATGPVVERVQIEAAAPAEPVLAAMQVSAASSYRLYATRIGLIGRTTANGTIIAPEDRFVALPSRRVLAVKGGREYEVRVEYKGRSITVPVWDIGPWNVRDNFWDAPVRRDMWNDLPVGRPQSAAAYFDAYHGGRDGFGRRVMSPAAIDLSDAAFYDLGMTNADWVQKTLLWQRR